MLEYRDKLTEEEKVAVAKPSLIDITVRGDAHFFAEFDAVRHPNASYEDVLEYVKSAKEARRKFFETAYEWQVAEMAAKRIDLQDLIFDIELVQYRKVGIEKTKVSKDAARLVCGTRLQVEPEDLMHLLADHPLYLEGDPMLYDNVHSLIIAEDSERILFLLEMTAQEYLGTVSGDIGVDELDWKSEIVEYDQSQRPTVLTLPEYVSQLIKAITYSLRYLLLLNTQRTPIETETRNYDGSRIKGPSHGRSYIPQRYVSLTHEYIRARKDYEAGSRGELDRYGKHLKTVEIAGFIRMQAYGEGHKLRRPQFIPGFTSSRWESDGIRIVKVEP